MLWLVSLSFAKNMKYSWMYQMSRLTYCCMFWCYKNRAVPYQQQMMHWQLWIEMFQRFIPREINEDCLFTFIQNDISVLKVKISHKVKFYLTVIQVCPFIYTSCESRKVTSLCISQALTKKIRCPDITERTIKLWQTGSVSLLNLVSCQTLTWKHENVK